MALTFRVGIGDDPSGKDQQHCLKLELGRGRFYRTSTIISRRSDTAAADSNTAMKVQYGTNITDWTDAASGPDIVITPFNDFHATGIDKMEVKIRRNLAGPAGKLFVRLNVVVTTP